jgi:hypothetical protein
VERNGAERTKHCSECETLEALVSSIRPRAFFDLYFRADEYDVRIVDQRVIHTVAVFQVAVLGGWTRDLRVVTVRRNRSERKRLVAALTVETLLIRVRVVRAKEGYGLDQRFEERNRADDDGDTGLDDRP